MLSVALFPSPSPTYPTGNAPSFVATGDFNHDGNQDIAVSNYNDQTISIRLGNGIGGFGAATTYPAGNGASQIVTGDFNNDGNLDLAVTNDLDDTISVFKGNGDGTFQPAVTSSTGNAYARSITVGDFNHDGTLDLAGAIDAPSGLVSVLIGKGDGTFQAPAFYNVGSSPVYITSGDFNGDGNVDLAVAAYSASAVSVLLGNGDGIFNSYVNYPAGNHPYAVTAADINGDGTLDLAVADYGGNSISILSGNGNGTFSSPVTYTAGAGPLDIVAADFNGDGTTDLAYVDSNGSNVGVLLGTGSGTFGSPTTYAVGYEPEGIAVADFNNDTQPDLVACNLGDSTVNILLNQLGFASAPPAQTALAARAQSFTLGTFGQTTTGPYSVDVNWGDGSADTTLTLSSPGTIPAQSHTYLTPGIQNLKAKVTVTDASGQTIAVAMFAVNVNALTSLTSIAFPRGGTNPRGNLINDAAGDLFGTTSSGGRFNNGTVFEISADRQTLITLVNFSGSNGAQPYAGLTLDSAGNFFGTTLSGGSSNYGTIFELSANHQTLTTLVNFNYSNGAYPYAGLTLDSAGNLFGTTYSGGSGDGTIFELSANHQTLTTLVDFNYSNREYPYAGLTLDSAGNLFGTTYGGGSNGTGTVFELSANHQTLTTLVNFFVFIGANPDAGLTLDSAGNVYGTTYRGGSGFGTIFELSANHQTLTTLVNFNSSNGVYPYAGLTLDNAGNLFGTTYSGGSGIGTIFEISPVPTFNPALSVPFGETTTLNANPLSGILATTYAGIAIQSGGSFSITPAKTAGSRQLLILNGSGLNLAGSSGAWTGSLDLSNNDLDITGGSLATISNQIQQGFVNDTWVGSGGIISVSASSDSTHLTALGVIQNNQSGAALFTSAHPFDGMTPGASDILVKYTYYGDANLDGKVDGSDYSRIDSGYVTHATGWFNGDFNYDGVVNGSDYTLIDNTFNTQGASLAAQVAPAAHASQFVFSQSEYSTVLPIFSDREGELKKHRRFSTQKILSS